MPILLTSHQLSKSFSVKPLFHDLSFTIETGDRIGLIGPNGAGKSTLLRILASQELTDEGEVSIDRNTRVAFLEQVPKFKPNATIHSTVSEKLTNDEDWSQLAVVDELISRLGLDKFGSDAPIDSLSGGWKKRVALARELASKPDLLLLDEPTNHLDIESILWLEQFLMNAHFAILMITHDRVFLQKVANRIIELDKRHAGGLLSLKGNYADFLELRDQMISSQENRETTLKNTLRREMQWLKQGVKARTTKQQARIDRTGTLAAEVSDLSSRNQKATAKLDFQTTERNPKKLIEAKGLSKSYGEAEIFSNLDLVVGPKSRIGLLGPNGAGKSTLIRSLLALEAPSTGTVEHSDRLSFAYFDQTRETLNPELTITETLCEAGGDHVDYRGKMLHVQAYLDRFLFSGNQSQMKVGKLSGGEQSRLLIARLMLREANVLILDEPTNDLDIATLNVLEDCLNEFTGAIILVTHDRYFLDRVANQLIAFPFESTSQKTLLTFSDLHQWENWLREEQKAKKANDKKQKNNVKKQKASLNRKVKLSYNELRELETMEKTIQDNEFKLQKLTEEMNLPDNQKNTIRLLELTQKMGDLQALINGLYERWTELESKKNEVEI